MNTGIPTPEGAGPWFQSRLALAYEQAKEIFVQRGNFLSDSDLLDLANHWTTNDMSVFDRDDDAFMTADMRDKDGLINALEAMLTPEPEPVKICVVTQYYPYDDSNVIGVYPTTEAAFEAFQAWSEFDQYQQVGVEGSSISLRFDRIGGSDHIFFGEMNVGEWYG